VFQGRLVDLPLVTGSGQGARFDQTSQDGRTHERAPLGQPSHCLQCLPGKRSGHGFSQQTHRWWRQRPELHRLASDDLAERVVRSYLV